MIDVDVRTIGARAGEEIAVSDWLEVTQARINQFAEATGDEGFTGMVAWNDRMVSGQLNPVINLRALPAPPPEPPAFTVPGDDVEPEPAPEPEHEAVPR